MHSDPPNYAWTETNRFPTRIRQLMDALMNGVTPSDDNTWLFSTNNRDSGNPNAVLSDALWCAGKVDLSPISVVTAGQTTSDQFPVILVHKHFVYSALHTRGNGPYVFKRPDGGYETRTVISWWAYPTISRTYLDFSGQPKTDTHYRDAAIGLLSAPIDTIQPVLVLPFDWYRWFAPENKPDAWPPESENGFEVPLYYLPTLYRKARKADGTQRARLTVGNMNKAMQVSSEYFDEGSIWEPAQPHTYSGESLAMGPEVGWSDQAIGGDSGSPMMWPWDNGRMILLATHYSAGDGPGIAESLPVLEVKMNALATSHGIAGAGSLALHKVDLSAFAPYQGVLAPTAANFPALKHFWDVNHISGAVLSDNVGTQHVTTDSGHWLVDSEGFAKWGAAGGNYCPANFEAPGNRDFMLIGCGRISWNTRASTIGGMASSGGEPYAAGIAFDVSIPPNIASPNAYLNANNYTDTAPWSFADDFSTFEINPETLNWLPNSSNPGIVGCFATVVSPSAGTCKSYWAGRLGQTAAYDPGFETHTLAMEIGSIQGAWPALGNGWTMFPGNRFEWVAILYFENGAPTNMEEAMRWMAQHNDIRLYPGWAGKL